MEGTDEDPEEFAKQDQDEDAMEVDEEPAETAAALGDENESPAPPVDTSGAEDTGAESCDDAIDSPGPPEQKEDPVDVTVRYLQQIVTLPRMNRATWTDEAFLVLRRFVEDPDETTVHVVLVDDQLRCGPGPGPSQGPQIPHVVLLKVVREPLTATRMHTQVTHLAITSSAAQVALAVIETVFARPIIFPNTSWPTSIKSKLCTMLHELFEELGRSEHAARGLTLLYLPREDPVNAVQYLSRIEEAVMRWCEQVSAAVEAEQLEPRMPLVTDLINFWAAKYTNMCFLQQQLQGVAIQQVLILLENSKSGSARLLRDLDRQITAAKVEAKSNANYLETLTSKRSKALESCKEVSGIPDLALELLSAARVVWLRAPYFCNRARVTQLFTCISHQVINSCARAVKPKRIFRGRPVQGLKNVSECIKVCKEYMRLYQRVAACHKDHEEHPWDLNTEEIFSSVELFIARCKDLQEICNVMMVLGRVNEVEAVNRLMFSGPCGRYLEGLSESIAWDTLKEIEALVGNQQPAVLDVTCATWQTDMERSVGLLTAY